MSVEAPVDSIFNAGRCFVFGEVEAEGVLELEKYKLSPRLLWIFTWEVMMEEWMEREQRS